MKIRVHSLPRGIALIIVMVAIFVLSVLVGAFALSMKVETKLAMNANHETQLTWLGRSGVELAKYVLAEQVSIPGEPYDSLNQIWAGGPGGLNVSNSPLADISLTDFPVGNGTVTVKITDCERKFNINMADERILNQALTLVGVDASGISAISGAIQDWIDPDGNTHIDGAESDYYQTLDPPYFAKDGPIDDLSELLLVKGVTLDMYWGSSSTNHALAAFQQVDRWGHPIEAPLYPVGLADLFTPFGSGKININTASITTLQMIPLVDENAAAQIVKVRSGPDGVDGTEDDTPFRNVGELINTGLSREAIPQITRYCDVRSTVFEVQVDAKIGQTKRTFYAIVGRTPPRNMQTLSFYWK